jgi:holo-[acyl-carrier protein] synthase
MDTYRLRSAHHAQRGVRFLATRFAAKEALSKAIGLGLHMPMTWRAAQVQNAPGGKPVIVCSGALAQFMHQHGLSAQVTLSDEDEYAVAFVIVEQAP